MIVFCAIDPDMAEAFREMKCPGDEVHIFEGNIFDATLPPEHSGGTKALVSPANSFGFMDGGIDLEYAAIFPGVERDVMWLIAQYFPKGILVGQSTCVSLNHPDYKALIVAPTMRFPQDISGTINTYLATRAALKEHEAAGNILFPAMGAGIGKMPPALCAHQMFQAYRDHLNPPKFNSCAEVAEHHWGLMHP